MKLTIYNGSPRRKKSNTDLLLNRLLQGFCSVQDNSATLHYLADKADRQKQIEDFANGGLIIIVMPLYCDAMPSIVKEFIEALPTGGNSSRKLGFIIQSGFEESYQSSFLKAYLDTLPRFFSCQYLGTVVKGGVEGIAVKPPFMTNKVYCRFEQLGQSLAQTGVFDDQIVNHFAKPYKYSKFQIFLYKAFFAGIANSYWTHQQKANGCYKERYAKPYI